MRTARRTRSVTRRVIRAARSTWNPKTGHGGEVHALILYPHDTFPLWSPGPGFRPVTTEMWWKPDTPKEPHGSGVVVVAGVGPKEKPSRMGGVWSQMEVWTVRLHEDRGPSLWTLRDKAHRVTWAEKEDILDRADHAGHPGQVSADALKSRVRFRPGLDAWVDGHLGGRPYLGLYWSPDAEDLVGLNTFARLVAELAARHQAQVRIYPGPLRRQAERCPVRCGSIRYFGTVWRDRQLPDAMRPDPSRGVAPSTP